MTKQAAQQPSKTYLPYKSKKHNAFEKGCKNLDTPLKQVIIDECIKIQKDPSIGEVMKGNFKQLDIKKHSVKSTIPELRILYKVNTCTNKNTKTLTCSSLAIHKDVEELNQCKGYIDFVICAPREVFNNFYKLSIDKLKKYLS